MASAKIVNLGLAAFAALLINSGQAVCKYGQIGTGTTNAAAVDTALQTPTNDARVAGTQSRTTVNVTNDTVQNVCTFTLGGAAAITEYSEWDSAGTGTPATGGTMSCRATFAAINLGIGDSLQVTSKNTLTSAT